MRMFLSSKYKTRNRGFTLIEILVVIVIISISVGLVVVNINIGGEDELAEQEVIRLQQLLRFAHQQSVIRAEEYGIRFYTTGYRFMLYDEESKSWVDISKDKLLRSRTLPPPLELDLYIEEIPVELLESQQDDPEVKDEEEDENKLATAASNTDKTEADKKDKIKPQVFLLSSSELTPQFEVRLRIPGSDIEEFLQGQPQGEYTREQADE